MEFDLNLCLSRRFRNGLRGVACTALVFGGVAMMTAAPARGDNEAPVAEGQSSSKDIRIAGTVMDANKEPLTGAVVKVVGKPQIATATDIEGNFYLNVPKGSEIEVTFVGFKPIKEKVGNKAAYEFTLYE
ncbi:MAG: carboxypeptidase-like regulatory domain-containing protein, partial [Muribaculaceae bacterium]|nr:carboxypeptidase-like regulatory domain-containing protein [Muribaculaceae bacterium]